MGEYERLKSQKDMIVAREREAIEQPLRDRIAILTSERDRAIDQTVRLFTEIGTLTDERDNFRADFNTVQKALADAHDRLRDAITERDALRADLRAVLQYPLRHNMCCASLDIAHVVEHDEVPPCDCGRDEALARPGVQAVVKD